MKGKNSKPKFMGFYFIKHSFIQWFFRSFRLKILHFCLKILHFCLQIFHVCLQIFNFCFRILHFCLKIFHFCLKIFHFCFKILQFCLKNPPFFRIHGFNGFLDFILDFLDDFLLKKSWILIEFLMKFQKNSEILINYGNKIPSWGL